jgi:PAS domain S-box-containing protein
VIDDEPRILAAFSRALTRDGFEVRTAGGGAEAVEALKTERFDVAVSDLNMPGMDGVETLAAMKAIDPDLEVIIATGNASLESAVACLRRGAYDYVEKPIDFATLREVLSRALEKRQLRGLVSLYDASRALLGTLSLADLLPEVGTLAQRVARASCVALALRSDDAASVEARVFGDDSSLPPALVERLERVALGSEAEGELAGPEPSRVLDATGGRFAHACVCPLDVGNRRVGALCVLRTEQLPAFTSAETQGLSVFALQVALAVDNARLYEELTQAQARAREGETRIRAVLDSAPVGIVTVGESGLVDGFNPAAERIFGLEARQASGRRFDELVAGASLDGFPASEAGAPAAVPVAGARSEVTGKRADGTVVPIALSAARLEGTSRARHCAFVQDLTESRKLEVELRHAQKLEAIGGLAAGIAHEINTPIQYVGDSASFLRGALADLPAMVACCREALGHMRALGDPRADELVRRVEQAEQDADLDYVLEQGPKAVDRVLEGVARVSAIVRAMKAFAHPGSAEKTAADLNKALQDTLVVARNELKYVAEVETDFADLPPVPCHLGDMNQVFLNLLVNAAHAIGARVGDSGDKGTIRVSTRAADDSVRIEVRDDGCGIPPQVRSRVFEPFFTTKEVGRGSGQGLAIARSIVVDRHGGSLSFESEVGRGTTFSIVLPLEPPGSNRPAEAR